MVIVVVEVVVVKEVVAVLIVGVIRSNYILVVKVVEVAVIKDVCSSCSSKCVSRSFSKTTSIIRTFSTVITT